jgi:hypothetical protein
MEKTDKLSTKKHTKDRCCSSVLDERVALTPFIDELPERMLVSIRNHAPYAVMSAAIPDDPQVRVLIKT